MQMLCQNCPQCMIRLMTHQLYVLTAFFNLGQLETLTVTSKQLASATSTDLLLSQVMHYVQKGWPTQVSQDLKPFFNRKHELTLEDNCLIWGIRVIVPAKFQKRV